MLEKEIFEAYSDPGRHTKPEALEKRGGGGYSEVKPVLAYDVEEYIYGPDNSLDENSFMIFIDAKPWGRQELDKLINFVKNITENFLVIAAGNGNTADMTQEHIIRIPPCEEFISPLISIVPFQVIAYRFAKSWGIEPEMPRYPNFHKMMGSK